MLAGACSAPEEGGLHLTGPADRGATGPYQSMMEPGSRNAELGARHFYIEEEYFLSGKANVYAYAGSGAITVETPDIPYTTRVVVMQPAGPQSASGIVYLFPFHPMQGMNFWESVRDFVLRNGHTYVGVLAGTDERSRLQSEAGNVIDALGVLQQWNAERYAAIDWPRDDGIRWDVFGQLARLLRSDDPNNPLAGRRVDRVYAVGWSFTGSFLRTYINEGFHDRYRQPSGAAAIDGYLVGISNRSFLSGYVPINSRSEVPGIDDPRRIPKPIDVPVIELMTENEAVTKSPDLPVENDHGIGRHRVYEVPGVTHGDGLRDEDPPGECPFPRSDVPFRQLAWAALTLLDDWATEDRVPPKAKPMQVDFGTHATVVDEYGIAIGGVRPAEIEVPLAHYGQPDDPRCDGGGRPYLVMQRIPFDTATLNALYPDGADQYLREYRSHIDRQVEEGWILAEDRQSLVDRAVEAAADAFGPRDAGDASAH